MQTVRIFTKINGKLASWETDANSTNYEMAVDAVKQETGNKLVLALIENIDREAA